jgi:cytochrome c-type biogenesis protein CcmH/NrfG
MTNAKQATSASPSSSSSNSSSFSSSSNDQWTSVHAYTLAVICLLLGIASGWLIHGSQSPAAVAAQTATASVSGVENSSSQPPTPAQMQKMADTQVGPLLEKLKADANNPELLTSIGNIYYDAQQYPTAIEYYQRVLKAEPANTGVRTDMATALWYTSNADAAIAEFQKALSYEPNNANTLFNLGIVEWQGKMDIDKAIATWQKLLDTNPNYEGKDKVLELMAQAKKHSGVKPGTPAKPLQ